MFWIQATADITQETNAFWDVGSGCESTLSGLKVSCPDLASNHECGDAGFLIVQGYFSPANPNGTPAVLANYRFVPEVPNAQQFSFAGPGVQSSNNAFDFLGSVPNQGPNSP
jgi:hypothetical protein